MSSSASKYHALKSSLSCVLKKKQRIVIPFFVETYSCQITTPSNHGVFLRIVRFNKESVDWLSFEKQAKDLVFLLKNPVFSSAASAGKTSKDSAFNFHTKSSCWSPKKVSLPLSRPLHQYASLNTRSRQKDSKGELDAPYCNLNSDKQKKDCTFVRPLLDFSRGVVTAICQHGKIPVYPDPSNQKLYYSRNRIRKQIVPSIQLFLNPQAENALFQFSELVLQEQDLISHLLRTTRE